MLAITKKCVIMRLTTSLACKGEVANMKRVREDVKWLFQKSKWQKCCKLIRI